MLRWAGAVPLIGGAVQWALRSVAAPYAGLVYGRSGSQFFFQDGQEGSRQPLLLRLAQDSPAEVRALATTPGTKRASAQGPACRED